MNLPDPRQKAAIDAAVSLINKTAASVADRVSDLLGTLSLSATKPAEREDRPPEEARCHGLERKKYRQPWQRLKKTPGKGGAGGNTCLKE